MSAYPLSPIGQFWLAMGAVKEERERQDAKWGSQRDLPNPTWLAILVEEVGEVAKAILERDEEGLNKEIVQVAAVAVAMIEAIDARNGKHE